MFDVSHMTVIDLHGARCREFLRHLLANNIDKLKVSGKALYSCMLNEHGGVIDDLIVYFLAEDFFRTVVNASTRDKDLAWIESQAKTFDVSVTERADLSMIAVQGPHARDKVLALLTPDTRAKAAKLGKFVAVEGDGLFIARTGYTGEDGFEIIVPAEHAARRTFQRHAQVAEHSRVPAHTRLAPRYRPWMRRRQRVALRTVHHPSLYRRNQTDTYQNRQ